VPGSRQQFRHAFSLLLLCASLTGLAQSQSSGLKASPLRIESEERQTRFFGEIDEPILVDVANLSLTIDPSTELLPLPKSWLGEFAITFSRDIKAQGTGLVCYRVNPTSLIASASSARVFHTWLLGANPDHLAKLLNGGMSLGEFDADGTYVNRIAMRAHPQGMGAIANSPENFRARVVLEVTMKLTTSQGQGSKMFEKPITPRAAQPLTLKPVPNVEPLNPTHQVIDWEDGKLTTIYNAIMRLNQECGLFFKVDPKIWDAPIFLKGKWDADDLAEAILIIADAPRGTYRRGDDLSALSDAYEDLLDKAGNEFGVPEEIYSAAKEGHSLPFGTILQLLPDAFAHLKTEEGGYTVSMREPVQIDMRLVYNIAGTGIVPVQFGEGRGIAPNGALMGAQRPKTSRG